MRFVKRDSFVRVCLTLKDTQLALRVGTLRLQEALRMHLKDRLGRHSLKSHVFGCECEIAVCKHLKLPWSESVNVFNVGDIGDDIQVRGTKYVFDSGIQKGYSCLKTVEKDDREWKCVLVVPTKRDNLLTIIGWRYSKDFRDAKWKRDPNKLGKPAYFLPWTMTYPIQTMPLGEGP